MKCMQCEKGYDEDNGKCFGRHIVITILYYSQLTTVHVPLLILYQHYVL